MADQIKSNTKVVTGRIRMSYANLFTPRAMVEGQDPKYSLCVLIPKSDKETVNLVRLNVRSGLDNQIYDEEYQRLEEEMQQLKEKKSKFDNTDLIREKGLQKVKEIKKVLDVREDIIKKFDDELFSQMVEQVKVISLVEVEFVYKIGVSIKEIL